MGGPAVPWRANSGVGWEGKMKLRFVKFLTSRGNEIEKKENEDGTTAPTAIIPPGRDQSLPSASLLPPSSRSLPPPVPPSTAPACPSPRVRRATSSSYPFPAVLLLPFFFIKLLKQQSVAGRTGTGTQLAGPAVLSNNNVARPARPPPLLLHPIGDDSHLPAQREVHPQRVEP